MISEDHPPLFSVVVTTHNRARLLAEAVASVSAQTCTDFECIVVDDGSVPPATLGDADQRFSLIRNEVPRGPAAARNQGVQAGCGRYVVFLDDDDQMTPDRLHLVVEHVAQRPALVVCAGGRVGGGPVSVPVLSGNVADTVLDTNPPHLGQVAALRDVCPRFDERFLGAEDHEWWLRAARVGDVVTDARVGWLWRAHNEPRGMIGTEARLRGAHQLLSLHAGYFASHRRAAAYRWVRIGWLETQLGHRGAAVRAALTALRLDPGLATLLRAGRLLLSQVRGRPVRSGGG